MHNTPHTEESKLKMSKSKLGKHYSPKTEFKKGITPWNTGKKLPFFPHTKALGRIPWNKGKKYPEYSSENHPRWKGNDVLQGSTHDWVKSHKGIPKKCERCGDTSRRMYDWANIDHKYKRNLDDYIRMCRSCHRKYDIINNKYKTK